MQNKTACNSSTSITRRSSDLAHCKTCLIDVFSLWLCKEEVDAWELQGLCNLGVEAGILHYPGCRVKAACDSAHACAGQLPLRGSEAREAKNG